MGAAGLGPLVSSLLCVVHLSALRRCNVKEQHTVREHTPLATGSLNHCKGTVQEISEPLHTQAYLAVQHHMQFSFTTHPKEISRNSAASRFLLQSSPL